MEPKESEPRPGQGDTARDDTPAADSTSSAPVSHVSPRVDLGAGLPRTRTFREAVRAQELRCRRLWREMSDEERAVRVLIAELGGAKRDGEAAATADADRPILVTPIAGVYDDPWSVAIVIRGTPPHGCLVAVLGWDGIPRELHLIAHGKSRCVASETRPRAPSRLAVVSCYLATLPKRGSQ